MTVRDEDKEEAVEIGRRFEKIGYKIFATEGTAKVLTETGVNVLTAIDTAKALITSLENTDIQKLTLIDIAKIK